MLAAVERLGRPTVPDLRRAFPHLEPSAIVRVLGALEARGLVEASGNPHWRYLGDPRVESGDGAPDIPDEEVVRYSARGGAAASGRARADASS